MRKTIRLITLVLTMILMSSLSFTAKIDVNIEDKQVNFNRIHNNQPIGRPYVENNRTYIPIRVVSEELGYEVTWIHENQTAIIEKGDIKVEIKIGETTALVNGIKTPIDTQSDNTKASIRSGRTYVPVRFISEAMGDIVDYRLPSTSDVKNQTVYINCVNLPVENSIVPLADQNIEGLIPLTKVKEMGLKVNFNEYNQEIIIEQTKVNGNLTKTVQAHLKLGSIDALIYDITKTPPVTRSSRRGHFKLNQEPQKQNGVVLVPLDFLAEIVKDGGTQLVSEEEIERERLEKIDREMKIERERVEREELERERERVERERERLAQDEADIQRGSLTQNERELITLINNYRKSLNLKPFSISKSLTTVARTHVKDSNLNKPENGTDIRGIKGNLHSWSDKGPWNPVCYTSDHEYSNLMWSKPSELTGYRGDGYEISYYSGGIITPQRVLNAWKGSSGHNNVIIGQGSWSELNTMGVAIDGNYSHVWFGIEDDPEGYYPVD